MAQPTAQEQEMLELLNRMRQNPVAELDLLLNSGDPLIQQALDFFKVDRALLRQQWTQLAPAAPVAWSSELNNSATGHNQKLIAADSQSHQLPGERSILERAVDSGYAANVVGENIYSYGESVLFGHAGFAIDWGNGPGGIQSPAGHRQLMTSNNYREVGIAITAENNPNTTVGPLVITQDFGNRTAINDRSWLLGVAYQDLNNNKFYDAGEGVKNVQVQVNSTKQPSPQPVITSTWETGGYQTQLTPGEYQIKFLWRDPNSQQDLLLATQDLVVDSQKIANIKRDLRLNQPIISIANASIPEGNAGNSNAAFTVSLASPSLELVTIDYTTVADTATAGSDFMANSGTLTFAPGETSKSINVVVVGDATVENNEVFTVSLTRPVNGSIRNALALGTIINDDGTVVTPPGVVTPPVELPVLSISNVSIAEGNQGNTNAIFNINLSAASNQNVSVNYGTSPNTATNEDFVATSGILTFAPGETSKSVEVSIVGDFSIEDAETFYLNLSNPVNTTLASSRGIGTIVNDDLAPTSVTPVVLSAKIAELQIQALSNKLLEVVGSNSNSPFTLRFTPIKRSGSGSDEVGVFAVDDNEGRIGGLLPNQDGYLQAALSRSQTIFSTLSDSFFDSSTSRQISFTPGQQLRFFAIKNSTSNAVKEVLAAAKTPDNVIIGSGSELQITGNGGKFNLAWNSTASNLQIQVELSSQPTTIGSTRQGQLDLIDLSGVGRSLLADFTVKSEAAYHNQVGFYTVDDALTGRVGNLNPGDVGYAEAALKRSVVNLDRDRTNIQQQISGDPILAPYLVANASVAEFLAKNPSNQANNSPQAYFAYLGANPDRVDHIKLLGDNYFGFEDVLGGGDQDYNDIVLNVKFT